MIGDSGASSFDVWKSRIDIKKMPVYRCGGGVVKA